jgi:hypothetical protein
MEGEPGTLRGTVTYAGSGLAVANVRVTARTTFQFYAYFSTTTAEDGTYELSLTGSVNVFVEDNGAGSFAVGQLYSLIECIEPEEVCDPLMGDVVNVPSNTVVEGIDFVVEAGGVLSGRYDEISTGFAAGAFPDIQVFDSSGNPLINLSTSFLTLPGQGRFYRTVPIPSGQYFVGASYYGFVDQIYPQLQCPGFGCDPTNGDLVALPSAMVLDGIDFLVTVDGARGGAISGTVSAGVQDLTFVPVISAWEGHFGGITTGRSIGSAGPYVIAGVSSGLDVQVTADAGDRYIGEIYDDVECDDDGPGGPPPCDLSSGMTLQLVAGEILPDIDFELFPPLIFADGFESGSAGSWSAVFP